MKNKITDLNNHLFAQLERLGDEDLTGEQLDREIKRTEAIVAVSEQLVRSATVSLKAAEIAGQYGALPSAVREQTGFALLGGPKAINGSGEKVQ